MINWKGCWGVSLHLGRVTLEFIITIFFSILPIIVGAIIASSWSEPSFSSAFISNFKYGEAFLYTSAFLVPYIYKKALREKKSIASIVSFLLATYSVFAGVYVFSFVRLEDVLSRKMSVSADNLVWFGVSIIFSTVVVWYYSVWQDHSKRIDPTMEDLRQRNALENDINAKLSGK
ncbi:TPA: hypothetical protein U5E43_003711 [Yersinia enterocolitica]|nr:hypothetical protein [Yersinia enterocolitica]